MSKTALCPTQEAQTPRFAQAPAMRFENGFSTSTTQAGDLCTVGLSFCFRSLRSSFYNPTIIVTRYHDSTTPGRTRQTTHNQAVNSIGHPACPPPFRYPPLGDKCIYMIFIFSVSILLDPANLVRRPAYLPSFVFPPLGDNRSFSFSTAPFLRHPLSDPPQDLPEEEADKTFLAGKVLSASFRLGPAVGSDGGRSRNVARRTRRNLYCGMVDTCTEEGVLDV